MAIGKHSAPEERYTYNGDEDFQNNLPELDDFAEELPSDVIPPEEDYEEVLARNYGGDFAGSFAGDAPAEDAGTAGDWEDAYGGAYTDDYEGAYDDGYDEEDAGKKSFFGALLGRLKFGKKNAGRDDSDGYDDFDAAQDDEAGDYAEYDAGYADDRQETEPGDYSDEAIGEAYEPEYEDGTLSGYDADTAEGYPETDETDYGEYASADGEEVYDEAYPEESFDAYGNPLYGDEQADYEKYAGADGLSGRWKERIPYLFAGIVAVLAVLAILFALLTLYGGAKKSDGAQEMIVVTEAPVIYPQATPEAVTAAAPESAGSIAVLKDGNLVPGDRGSVVPERDTPLSLDDFYGTTMIGNSFVEGMQLWSDINTTEYVCADGVSLDNMIGNYLYFVTVRSYSSIYLTLGINEIGWQVDSFISKYEKVIDYIRSDAYSPHAIIYVTSVFPVEEIMETTAAESGSTISLETVQKFNEALKEMCQRKGCWYLDVYSALADSRGYLPADVAADDHVHFEKTGYRIWTDYLLNHYVDESLLEG